MYRKQKTRNPTRANSPQTPYLFRTGREYTLGTRVPNLVVLVILGYVPRYPRVYPGYTALITPLQSYVQAYYGYVRRYIVYFMPVIAFRLILTRIRFLASDFGQVANYKLSCAQNRRRPLVRNQMRRWRSGHMFVCSCDSAVRFLGSESSSQCRLLLCLTPRRDALSALRSALDSSILACAD